MPIDTSMYFQQQQPQIENPLDVQAKALTLKHLAYQNQVNDRQIADDQAVRSAYQNNISVGPDGNPTVNRAGVMSALANNPMMALKTSQDLNAQDQAKRDQQMKDITQHAAMGKDLAWSVPTDPNVPLDQKQAAWTQMKAKAAQIGLPNNNNLPDQYPGDAFVNHMKVSLLTADEQLKQQNADRTFRQKDQENALKHQDIAIKRDQLGSNKQNQAMQDVQKQLETARGNPAAAQAEKDLYAANKFESLVNLYGDPNKLNPAQVKLGATEVIKIASGGVPTSHELQGMTPDSIPGSLAELAQKVVNNPVAANQGAFMNAMKDYTTALKGDAQKVVLDKYGRVIESRKAQLGDANYKSLQDQYLNRFKTPDANAETAAKVQRLQALRAKAGGE